MKRIVVIIIEDNKENSLEVTPFANDVCNINITAPDEGEALNLLSQGFTKAKGINYNDIPEQIAPKPIDKSSAEELLEEYEKSKKGQRFIKKLHDSGKFFDKHCHESFYVSELTYLARKHNNSLLNGLHDIASLYYKFGYDIAKKEIRNK